MVHGAEAADAASAREEWRRGWPQVAGAAAGMSAGLYMFSSVSGFFVKPLSAAFGWSRGELAATSAAMFVVSLLLPLAGAIADRRGVRIVAAVGSVTFAVAYVALASMSGALWQYFAALALVALIGGPCTVPFLLARPTVSAFHRSRGLALGLGMSGTPLLCFAVLPILQAVIAAHGWRAGYLMLAPLSLGLGGLAFVLLGRAPAAAGIPQPPAPSAREAAVGQTFGQALRDPRFVLLALAVAAVTFPVGVFISSLQPLLSDRGVPGQTAAMLGVWYSVAVVIGRLSSGVLLDRFWPPLVASVALGGPFVGLLIFLGAGAQLPLLFLAIAFIALAIGAETDILSFLAARYFGLRAFGAINGALGGIATLSIAVGGITAGVMFDRFGGYDRVFVAGAALSAFAAVAVLLSGGWRPTSSPAGG